MSSVGVATSETQMSDESISAAAFEYRRLGWNPIPLCRPRKGPDGRVDGCIQHGPECGHPGKVPLIAKWNTLRDVTEDRIAGWGVEYGRYNIGLVLGAGVAALDVDPRNGGATSLEGIEIERGALPDSAKQVTPSGGWHLFGRYDPTLSVRKYVLTDGLDFLAEGSQIVAAPSAHSKTVETGEPYMWEDRETPPNVDELPEFPGWLLKPASNKGAGETSHPEFDHALARRVMSALAAIPCEDRDRWLQVGMATKSLLGEAGWTMFDAWSETSAASNYDRCENRRQWDSLAPGDGTAKTVNGKTLFYIARNHGWSDQRETSTQRDWKPPVSLDELPVPPFPADALGGRFADWARAVAESTQTPPDMAAMLGLSAIAASVQGRFRVRVGGDWTESLSLYVAVAVPPAERKTAVLGQAVGPIEDWETETRKRLAPTIEKAQREYDLATERVTESRRRYARASADKLETAMTVLKAAEAELDVVTVPVAPRILLDDATPESTGLVISANGGRIAALTDEGGLFETLAGRYNDGVSNLDLFLKGYDGSSPWRRDRVRESPTIVRRPSITLGLAVQPDVVCGLARKRGFRGRGFIGRFAYAMPKSALGSRTAASRPVPDGLRLWYREAIQRLLDLPDKRDEDGEIEPSMLELTPEAREFIFAAVNDLEPRLGPGGDLAEMSDWAGKSIGRVVRIAALLHLTAARENTERPVPLTAVQRALQIGEYLIEHARAAFDLFGLDEALSDARAIWRWLETKRLPRFAYRTAWQALKQRFKNAKRLELALTELEERGYVALLEAPAPGKRGGRPARADFLVNPLAFSQHPESVPKTPETSSAKGSGGFGEHSGADETAGDLFPDDGPTDWEH